LAKNDRQRGVNRLVQRGATRSPAIGIAELPRAVQRIAEREDGVARSSASSAGSASPQPAATPSHQGGPDMRSSLVRKVVEMAHLQRSQDLEQAARAPAEGKAGSDDALAGATLEQWYEEMKTSGLSEPEIEEHIAQRLRSVRSSLLEFEELRSVGRGR